ncbi:MAG: LptF/LptG family permease [Kiritimatiellae bacterium]|nr:LptF/LptG family permease [Kiritimatiellia bacterium]
MRILWRYIFREFLIPLTYCLAGFVGIYVLFKLFGSFSRISSAHLGFGATIAYLAAYLSPFFKYLAPAALMLATLYTMWSFCRHSELTAMRASGISLATIVRPLLFAAFLVACFVAWVNECYMPSHALWAKRLEAARFDRAKAAVSGLSYADAVRGHVWTVEGDCDADCKRLSGVRIEFAGSGGVKRIVRAANADWLDGEWWLSGVESSYSASGLQVASPSPDLDGLPFRVFPELTETPEDILLQQSDALPFNSSLKKLEFAREAQNLPQEKRNDIVYDAWAQALSPFACIIITLLAIPAGISTGRQAVFGGVLGALVLFFAYYGLDMACFGFARTGLVPPVPAAIITPSAFLVLGIYNCFRPLRMTLVLAGIFFVLVVVYVLMAHALTSRLGVDAVMAHSLAATFPMLAAGGAMCALKRRRRA